MYFITCTLLVVLGFGYLSAAIPTPTTRDALTRIRALPDINMVIRDPEAIDGKLCIDALGVVKACAQP